MTRTLARLTLLLAVLLVGMAYLRWGSSEGGGLFGPRPEAGGGVVTDTDGAEAVVAAFREQRSNVWVEIGGRVIRTLADDNRGSRHQRFIVEIPGGQTVLVSHNIDLAPRVPLAEGDDVRIRGEYEWNDRGGVIHWTHHDPDGRRDGGWIDYRGRTYR